MAWAYEDIWSSCPYARCWLRNARIARKRVCAAARSSGRQRQLEKGGPPRESRTSKPQPKPRAGGYADVSSPLKKKSKCHLTAVHGVRHYSVVAIEYDASLHMLAWLLPQLRTRTGAIVAKRDSRRSATGNSQAKRGSSIIFTRKCEVEQPRHGYAHLLRRGPAKGGCWLDAHGTTHM